MNKKKNLIELSPASELTDPRSEAFEVWSDREILGRIGRMLAGETTPYRSG